MNVDDDDEGLGDDDSFPSLEEVDVALDEVSVVEEFEKEEARRKQLNIPMVAQRPAGASRRLRASSRSAR